MTFITSCLNGEVLVEDIDDFVEAWHEGREGANQELHEYLGMSWEEYSIWPRPHQFYLSLFLHVTSEFRSTPS